jgi:hypothetical protein
MTVKRGWEQRHPGEHFLHHSKDEKKPFFKKPSKTSPSVNSRAFVTTGRDYSETKVFPVGGGLKISFTK